MNPVQKNLLSSWRIRRPHNTHSWAHQQQSKQKARCLLKMTHSSRISTHDRSLHQLHLLDTLPTRSKAALSHQDLGRVYTRFFQHALNGSHKPSLRRRCNKALFCVVLAILALFAVTLTGRLHTWPQRKTNRSLIPDIDRMQFVDARHDFFRVMDRWTAENGRRKDSSFPGTYFDFSVNGTKSVFLSLHNGVILNNGRNMDISVKPPQPSILPSEDTTRAQPISLLVRVDDDDYMTLQNVSSIVALGQGNLDPLVQHTFRIIAPMVSENDVEMLQVKGVFIDIDGHLVPFNKSPSRIDRSNYTNSHHAMPKMLEIVTDFPGRRAGQEDILGRRKALGILGGMMNWNYLLGEMFSADHVTIEVSEVCLVQKCFEGGGSLNGLADVFFRSGLIGTEQYKRPWLIQDYVPDVMILSIGTADWESLQMYDNDNKTIWESSMIFEETYVAFIKDIRTFAYPQYSASAVLWS